MKFIKLTNVLRGSASTRALLIALGAAPLALASLSAAQAGPALPSHGHFVAGSGAFGRKINGLTIDQASVTGVINWNSFSIGKGASVQFNNANGATLNRVTGGNLSTIAGSLHATGSLYLVNSQGVIVSGSGRVVTGGSFVTTSGTLSDPFNDTRVTLKSATGGVANQGSIIAGGAAVLAGHNVGNSGNISAANVTLRATRDLRNTGVVEAQRADGSGGAIYLGARNITAGGSFNASATQAGKLGGRVRIIASDGETLSTTIDALGGVHGKGGFVETSAAHLHVADQTRVSTLSAQGTAGTWLIDPDDLTIAPTGGDMSGATISANLANGDVFIFSNEGAKSGNGDIFVDDNITWSSGSKLLLSAARNVEVNGTITDAGTGNLDFEYGGSLEFTGGSADFTGAGVEDDATRLTENNQAYTLVSTIGSLALNIASAPSGHFALATDTVAPVTAYGASPVPAAFSGMFDGLGHTISNLTISNTSTANATEVGLFSELDTGGAIRNVSLSNVDINSVATSAITYLGALIGFDNGGSVADVSVSGAVTGGAKNRTGGIVGFNAGSLSNSSSSATINAAGDYVGGAVGYNSGAMTNVTASGSVTGGNAAGGLAGFNDNSGTITTSSASGDVNYSNSTYLGGLVGEDFGAVINSSASGDVTSSVGFVGGLIGYAPTSAATVSGSHASGNESGTFDVGGLIGYMSGTTTNSYATGNASGVSSVGGLIGINFNTVTNSYATGTVTDLSSFGTGQAFGGLVGRTSGAITGSYATGAVNIGTSSSPIDGDYAGGLVGFTSGTNAHISNSYATGTVTSYGANEVAGGLVGVNNNGSGGTVDSSYATGNVSVTGAGAMAGGLVGRNAGAITNSWAGTIVGVVGDSAQVGGLVGANTSSIQYAYAIGSVTATGTGTDVGGLVGADTGTIDNTYATGSVSESGPSGLLGGLVGSEATAGNLTNSYWDSTTTGRLHSIGTGGGTDTAGAIITDTVHAFTESVYSDFNFTGSGHWVMFDGDTRPMLKAEESTTITDAHQLQLMAMNLGGDYTLANDIDMSGEANASDVWKTSTGFVPIGNNSTQFDGSLDGDNYTIIGLFIDRPTTNQVGLFGDATGATFSDFGLENSGNAQVTGGAFVGSLAGSANNSSITNVFSNIDVSGSTFVGGLVGSSTSEIDNSHATGLVMGNPTGQAFGGLVGASSGNISNSYATGAVLGGGNYTGGLIGLSSTGTISSSFASGLVQGQNYTGGLVGENDGTIEDSYAMGLVDGAIGTGGLVGHANGGSISDSYSLGQATGTAGQTGGSIGVYDSGLITDVYWDTQTSGIGSHKGAGNIADGPGLVGRTTSQLKAALQTGFDPGTWSVSAATSGTAFAYLQWQYAAGFDPQTLSGTVTTQVGGKAVSPGAQINVLVNGAAAGTAFTYADGSYYLPSISTHAADDVLAYIVTGTSGFPSGNYTKGNAFVQDAGTGSLKNVNIYENALHEISDQSDLSALTAGLINAAGATNADFLFDGSGALAANTGLVLDVSAHSFDIDSAISLGTADLIIRSSHAVTQSQAIASSGLLLSGGGNFTLTDSSNAFSFLGGSVGSLHVLDHQSIAVENIDGAQGLSAKGAVTIGTAANMFISGRLKDAGHTVTLNAGQTIFQGTSGTAITAATLTGSAHGDVLLQASNAIGALGAFSTGNGDFELKDTKDLAVTGALNAGTGAIAFATTGSGHDLSIANTLTGGAVSLVSAGTLSESGAGKIHATSLTGSSSGGATLNGANLIGKLDSFTNAGANGLALTDDKTLTVKGAVHVGTGNLTLATVGNKHNIVIDSALNGHIVTLTSGGAISSNATGIITASTLTGSSVGTTSLTAANVIANLGAFTASGFSLTDAHDLTTKGTVNAGTHTVVLKTTGAGHDIAIDSTVEGKEAKLLSAATITESGAGDIDATTLTGSTDGKVVLTGAGNTVADLGSFTTGGNHSFALTDDDALTVIGAINAGTGALNLTTTGSNHDLAIASALTGGTVTFVTTGEATETKKGAIKAKLLNVSASTGIQLTSKANAITKLGTVQTTTGPNKITL